VTGRRKQRAAVRVTSLAALNFGGGGDVYLREATEVIANTARGMASWSRQIPASMSVDVGDDMAVISAGAPNARPAELRLNHPLFGDREHWYGPPGRPFLSPAAEASSDEAMARYANKIDQMAAKAGFR
jgi:hypothetical protein